MFCPFVALVLKSELEQRIGARGRANSWSEIRAHLDSLTETAIVHPAGACSSDLRRAPPPASRFAPPASPPPTVQALAADCRRVA